MNSIVPDKFNVDGTLNIRFEQDSLILLAVVIIIIIIVALVAQKILKTV